MENTLEGEWNPWSSYVGFQVESGGNETEAVMEGVERTGDHRVCDEEPIGYRDTF